MKTYIIFTSVKEGINPNIYPNLVEAENHARAIDMVLAGRPNHTVVASSYSTFSYESHQSPKDFTMYTAITEVMPPLPPNWVRGQYLKFKELP